ncbi:serine/threonine protein kinase, AGC [Phlyctochytrium planicorne]|nr:serine/threonine protein kinase, AGC [Phlyctochytrium planicorne]
MTDIPSVPQNDAVSRSRKSSAGKLIQATGLVLPSQEDPKILSQKPSEDAGISKGRSRAGSLAKSDGVNVAGRLEEDGTASKTASALAKQRNASIKQDIMDMSQQGQRSRRSSITPAGLPITNGVDNPALAPLARSGLRPSSGTTGGASSNSNSRPTTPGGTRKSISKAKIDANPEAVLQKELNVLQNVTQRIGSANGRNSASGRKAHEDDEEQEDVGPLDGFDYPAPAAGRDSRGGTPLPPIPAGQNTTSRDSSTPSRTKTSSSSSSQNQYSNQKMIQSNPMLANHMIRSCEDTDGLPDFPRSQVSLEMKRQQQQQQQQQSQPSSANQSAHHLPTYQAGSATNSSHELPSYGTHMYQGAEPTQEEENAASNGKRRIGRGLHRRSSQGLLKRDPDKNKPGTAGSQESKQPAGIPPSTPSSQTAISQRPSSRPATRNSSRPIRDEFGDEFEEQSSFRNYDLFDFEIKEQIGKGAFARVHLVRFQPRGDSSRLPPSQISRSGSTKIIYAMKSLRKVDIVATKQVKHVMNERDLLRSVRHPFIVNLLATFQDPKHLYLIMEYVPGGDMFTHLKKFRRFPEHVARFYTAEILLALEYIHSKDIVYRDLKPENILLALDGHIKIADFGFAKRLRTEDIAMTFCGTPAYMAPEIILKHGYSKSVDWWSLGIVCYELQAGYSPFQADNALRIYENIVDGEMRWSSQINATAKDLIRKLLEMSPARRLGSGRGGAREIKDHVWFRGLDWKGFEAKEIAAPHVPTVANDGDVSNFDVYTETSSVIMMQNGTLEVTANDCLYDDTFKDF